MDPVLETQDGYHLGTLIYRPGFMIGKMRAMEIESEYQPRTQVTNTYLSTRFDFKPMTTNDGDVLDPVNYRYATVVTNDADATATGSNVPHDTTQV